MSGVVNDQLANETTFNAAFLARNGDTSAAGKIDLVNNAIDPTSGADIINLQKNINALCSSLGIAPNQVASFVMAWANAYVGSASSDVKSKIEALVLKFRDTAAHGSHAHTGVDGDAAKISATDLANINQFTACYQNISVTGASGSSVDISSLMTGKVSGGSSSVAGVITSAPNNRVWVVDSSTETFLEDAGGQRIYGRITYSTGTWTLSFYTNEAGTETAATLTSTTINAYFLEVFTLASRPTIPSNPAQFGTLDVTGDVIDASATTGGKVNTAAQSFAGLKTFVNGLVNQAQFTGDVVTDSASTGADQILSIPGKMILRVTNSSLASIAGFTASTAPLFFFLVNGKATTLDIKNLLNTATTDINTGSNNTLTMKAGAVALVVRDTTAGKWLVVGGGGGNPFSLSTFGSTPAAEGATYNATSGAFALQPADATHPGGVSTAAQSFGGFKAFEDGWGSTQEVNSTLTGTDATLTWTKPMVKLTNSSLVSIAQIKKTAGYSGLLWIRNATAFPIIFRASTGADATQQISTTTAKDYSLQTDATIILCYDNVASRWTIVSAWSMDRDQKASLYKGWLGYAGTADAGTAEWVAYADSGSRPTDGLGGAPSITWTRSTTNPLNGIASFLFTKPASNVQGQGVSIDFFVNRSEIMSPRLQTITADWELVSGTYSDGAAGTDSDLIVYIYSTTSGKLIEPSAMKVMQGQSIQATFQPLYNENGYRLMIHVATTSTSAFVAKFDNIEVAPVVRSQGYSAGTPQIFTPSLTTNYGANAVTLNTSAPYVAPNGVWVKKGEKIEMTIGFQNGGGAAATGTAGPITILIPNGMAPDINNMGRTATYGYVVGSAELYIAAPGFSGKETVSIAANGGNYYLVIAKKATGSNYQLSDIAASSAVSYTIEFPVLGWSANTQVSDGYDGRVISCSYQSNASQGLTVASTLTMFGTKMHDDVGAYNPVTGIWTCKSPGKYHVSMQVFTITGTSPNNIALLYNNNPVVRAEPAFCATSQYVWKIDYTIECKVGDQLAFYTYASGGSTASYNSSIDNYFSIDKLPGAAQVQAADSVVTRAYSTAGTSYNNGPTTYVYAIKDYDATNCFNTSTNTFTAQSPGTYRFTAKARVGGTATVSQEIWLTAVKTAIGGATTTYRVGSATGNGSNTWYSPGGSTTIKLLTGETVVIKMNTNTAANVVESTVAHDNALEIEKVGNY